MNFVIEYAKAGELTPLQQRGLDLLNQECFGDVPQDEVEEDFAYPDAFLFAMIGQEVIARIGLYKRDISFTNQSIVLGGIGGVCVTTKHRHHGIASSLIKRGLLKLKEEQCDLACLNVDLDKKIYGIYTKLGFTMMERNISFENIHGQVISEPGSMFIPLCSQEKYDLVMNSSETFHYGRGYL